MPGESLAHLLIEEILTENPLCARHHSRPWDTTINRKDNYDSYPRGAQCLGRMQTSQQAITVLGDKRQDGIAMGSFKTPKERLLTQS